MSSLLRILKGFAQPVISIHFLAWLQVCKLFRLSVLHAHAVYSCHQCPSSSAWWPNQDSHEEGLLPGLWLLSLDLQGCGNGWQICWWVLKISRYKCNIKNTMVQVIFSSLSRKLLSSSLTSHVFVHFAHCSQWWMARARESAYSTGEFLPHGHFIIFS